MAGLPPDDRCVRAARGPATIHLVSKLKRVSALPWAVSIQVGVAANKRWRKLSKRERARLSSLLRDSGGRPGNLSPRERAEVRKLVGKLELKSLGRELLPLVRGSKRKRR